MANLKAIRIRISSVKSTRQITSAMKMVSAAKTQKGSGKNCKAKAYASKLHVILVNLSQSLADAKLKMFTKSIGTTQNSHCGGYFKQRPVRCIQFECLQRARRLAVEKYCDQFQQRKREYFLHRQKRICFLRKTKCR